MQLFVFYLVLLTKRNKVCREERPYYNLKYFCENSLLNLQV
jgi:hypothetical protein